ncbi:MAG: type II toxin-antitoxin system MqsR family toxin [Deltaproteobacteria bacterium]|nr:type II toxin-antitoxin system MqsR family toxin [Deltaproteobacteria bacterium]
MEKKTPHYSLELVKALLAQKRATLTRMAAQGATALGMNKDDVFDVVSGLTPKDLHKSMTTHADHTIWQDVYKPNTLAGRVYLKLTVQDGLLIVSFKEDES